MARVHGGQEKSHLLKNLSGLFPLLEIEDIKSREKGQPERRGFDSGPLLGRCPKCLRSRKVDTFKQRR